MFFPKDVSSQGLTEDTTFHAYFFFLQCNCITSYRNANYSKGIASYAMEMLEMPMQCTYPCLCVLVYKCNAMSWFRIVSSFFKHCSFSFTAQNCSETQPLFACCEPSQYSVGRLRETVAKCRCLYVRTTFAAVKPTFLQRNAHLDSA